MALIDGFPGVSGASDFGEIRRAFEALILRNSSGLMRAGVLPGSPALLTARPDMRVDIADFRAVLNRQGAVFIANVGPEQSPQLDVAPSANRRIDVIYVHQRIAALGDGADGPIFGVLKGQASSTPAKRTDLPEGALELGTVEVAANVSSTDAANVVVRSTCPFTTMGGGALWVRAAAELNNGTAAQIDTYGTTAYALDTGAFYTRLAQGWVLDGTGYVLQAVGTSAVGSGGVSGVGIGSGTRLRKTRDGWVEGYIDYSRSSIPNQANLARVDSAFWPVADWVGSGAALINGNAAPVGVRVNADGYIQTISSAGQNTSIRFNVAYQGSPIA